MDLETGYTIKVDTLRKLREKTTKSDETEDGSAVAAIAVAAADTTEADCNTIEVERDDAESTPPFTQDTEKESSETITIDDDDERDDSPVLPLAVVSPPPPATSSLLDFLRAPQPLPERDEKELLVDEYAPSCVPLFLPPPVDTQASQSASTSEDEGEVDLSVLMRDDDDPAPSPDPPPASRTRPSAAPSSRLPSSAAIAKLLSESGTLAQHQFQRVIRGSRMEVSISDTAHRVYQGRTTAETVPSDNDKLFFKPSNKDVGYKPRK